MSREFTCDNCGVLFADRDWMYPVDERKDYCGKECYNEAKENGVIIECPNGCGDVTAPHNNCAMLYIKRQKKLKKSRLTP